MAELVMELAACSREDAEKALAVHKEVWLAVESLLPKPEVAGDKYIPPKRKVDTGLSAEQEERCLKGRVMQDKINVVFSVAHSQLRNQPDPASEALEASPPLAGSALVGAGQFVPPPDADERTTLSVPLSESPP